MKVLFLGPRDSSILAYLRRTDHVRATRCPIKSSDPRVAWADWLVSHRYTYKVPSEVLEQFGGDAINVHLGLCGQHRGVHPVFFTALADGNFGYTIHRMVSRFDAGPVYTFGAREFFYMNDHTFRSVWNQINDDATEAFKVFWDTGGICIPEDKPLGTYYSKADFERLKWVLEPDGWDTRITVAKERYENRAYRK